MAKDIVVRSKNPYGDPETGNGIDQAQMWNLAYQAGVARAYGEESVVEHLRSIAKAESMKVASHAIVAQMRLAWAEGYAAGAKDAGAKVAGTAQTAALNHTIASLQLRVEPKPQPEPKLPYGLGALIPEPQYRYHAGGTFRTNDYAMSDEHAAEIAAEARDAGRAAPNSGPYYFADYPTAL